MRLLLGLDTLTRNVIKMFTIRVLTLELMNEIKLKEVYSKQGCP